MTRFIVHRLLIMALTLIAISVTVFIVIHLPSGDYLDRYVAVLEALGESIDPQMIRIR